MDTTKITVKYLKSRDGYCLFRGHLNMAGEFSSVESAIKEANLRFPQAKVFVKDETIKPSLP